MKQKKRKASYMNKIVLSYITIIGKNKLRAVIKFKFGYWLSLITLKASEKSMVWFNFNSHYGHAFYWGYLEDACRQKFLLYFFMHAQYLMQILSMHKVHQALVLCRALDHVTIRQMKLLKKSDTYRDVEDALFKLRWVYICLRPHGNMEKQRSILCGIYMSWAQYRFLLLQ